MCEWRREEGGKVRVGRGDWWRLLVNMSAFCFKVV